MQWCKIFFCVSAVYVVGGGLLGPGVWLLYRSARLPSRPRSFPYEEKVVPVSGVSEGWTDCRYQFTRANATDASVATCVYPKSVMCVYSARGQGCTVYRHYCSSPSYRAAFRDANSSEGFRCEWAAIPVSSRGAARAGGIALIVLGALVLAIDFFLTCLAFGLFISDCIYFRREKRADAARPIDTSTAS